MITLSDSRDKPLEEQFFFGDEDGQAYKDQNAVHQAYIDGMMEAIDFEQADEVQRQFHETMGIQDEHTDAETQMGSRVGLFRALMTEAVQNEDIHDDTDSAIETVELVEGILHETVMEYVGLLLENAMDEEIDRLSVDKQAILEIFQVEDRTPDED